MPQVDELQQYLKDSMSKKYAIPIRHMSPEAFADSKKRRVELHPSSFPYCGLQHGYSLLTDGPRREREFALGNYYLDVGTTVHTLFQKMLGLSGQIFGDWKCARCGKFHKAQTYPGECSSCQSTLLDYEELPLTFGSFIHGKKDGIFVERSSKAWTIDYKTTYSSAIYEHEKTGKKFPYASNKFQIESYVVMFEDQYKMTLEGGKLIYVARDHPNKISICTIPMDAERKAEVRARLNQWDQHFSVAHDIHKAQPKEALKRMIFLKGEKLCPTKQFYRDNVHTNFKPCPLASQCFGDKLDKRIKDATEYST